MGYREGLVRTVFVTNFFGLLPSRCIDDNFIYI